MTAYNATPWADRAMARLHWPDATSIADTVLDTFLTVATSACKAYAPAIADTDTIPVDWALATIYQARDVYAAGARDSSDVIGFGDYAIRARDLSTAVKALLRPRRGVGPVG